MKWSILIWVLRKYSHLISQINKITYEISWVKKWEAKDTERAQSYHLQLFGLPPGRKVSPSATTAPLADD